MLGTNDCKTEFNATVNEITNGLDVIISQIRLFDSRTKIILVCPVYISETVLSHNFSTSFDESSIPKSIELEEKIRKEKKRMIHRKLTAYILMRKDTRHLHRHFLSVSRGNFYDKCQKKYKRNYT